jgi:hypothetical protein
VKIMNTTRDRNTATDETIPNNESDALDKTSQNTYDTESFSSKGGTSSQAKNVGNFDRSDKYNKPRQEDSGYHEDTEKYRQDEMGENE